MRKKLIFMLLLFPAAGVQVVTLAQLFEKVQQPNDTLYVVNFWATWCRPCVEEMPFFEKARQNFAEKKVKVVFVSLNSPKEKASVEKFLIQRNIQSETVLLQAGNPNLWLQKIDSSWSGSLPATVLYRNGKKLFFHEGDLNQTALDSVITKYIP